MSGLITLLDFAGYVALLLWGVHMVQTGVQRAFGAALGAALGRALGTRLRAFAAGLGITAALQSSTATGLMITGFAAGGVVGLVPALAAMLGANVGTTLIVQLLSFDLTSLAPILILAGVWMFRRYPPGRTRDLGRVFIGLGLLLLSLHQLVELFEPFQTAPMLGMILDALATQPVAAVLLSAAFTWAAHSSVAVVVLVMSLASHHMVAPHVAFALVLGANLGTAINPMIEGVTGDDPAARRLPLGNLLTRILGVLAGLVKVSVGNAEGKVASLTGVPAGGWIGEGSLLKREVRKYDIVALRDSVVARLPAATFDWLLDTSIPFNRYLLHQLNERVAQFIGKAEYDRLLDPDARVARCLAELFNPLLYPGMGMRLTITQEEVGYLARVSRQRANQALRKLEEAGLLNVEYGAVRVLDLDGLKLYGSDRGALEGEHAA